MFGEKRLKDIAKTVLSLSGADQTEVLLFVTDGGLTRFANNQIHQNVASEDLGLSVRVVVNPPSHKASVGHGKRIGVASANSFAPASVRDVVDRAMALAALQKEDPYFVSLPEPGVLAQVKMQIYQATPEERAQAVWVVIKKAKDKGIVASGAYGSTIFEVAVGNSCGVWGYYAGSSTDLSTVLMGEDSTGFAAQLSKNPDEIDPEGVADRAIEKVVRGRRPIKLVPREYTVVLEPQAVNEMMSFFSWLGPNARIYHEDASFLSGKLGEQVFGENITIVDDPLSEEGFPMPFDFEGVPKRRLEIVKRGKFTNVVYDSNLAARYGKDNTGHALPAPNTYGPVPLHLQFEPGTKSLEEIVKGVKKGLLVSRLWYVRTLNPKTLSITGMTRDGTFLIDNGEIVSGVRNLRFNQSIPEALRNVVEVGRDLENLASFETELGTNRMPALCIKNWNFTSTTEF